MLNPMNPIPEPFKLYAEIGTVVLVGAMVGGWTARAVHHERDIGRHEVQQKWDVAVSSQRASDLAQSEANAAETARRLKAQKESQDAQTKLLAAARADADRNRAAADSLRQQSADTAKRWRDTLSNSPTVADSATAGDAIVLSAELFSRIDKRAGELAAYADAARLAGAQCESDYRALTP
jgi:hypothetical protein